MADQPANGTEAKAVDLHAMRDRGRAAFMGAFQSGGELADVAPTETEPKPAAKTEAEPAAPASTPAKKTAPVDDFADDAPAADDEFADEPAEREVDADTRRRIERVQQTEAKSREALARKEAELERKYAADRADAEAFRKLKARARYAPGDVLAELDPDLDWDFASKDAFARTKAAADDPKWRDAARSMSKGREQDDKLGLALKRIEALESEVKTHREVAQAERQIEQYFDKATKLVSPEVS